MPPLAVYDAMVMLQWAALPDPAERQHATVRALVNGDIRLAMSARLLDEIRGVFFRPELQRRLPSLTPQHAAAIIKKALEFSEWFENVPSHFTLPLHPKDDHLFDLAIESRSAYLVTWENRLLGLRDGDTIEARRLRQIAPALAVMSPKEFAEASKGKPPAQ